MSIADIIIITGLIILVYLCIKSLRASSCNGACGGCSVGSKCKTDIYEEYKRDQLKQG